MMNSTARRFNDIRWHDSKLLALCFYRVGSEELVKISCSCWEKVVLSSLLT